MKLVAFEGMDGAGKTTVRHSLAQQLSQLGIGVRESGEFESDFGAQLRPIVATLTATEKVLLFAADRSLSLRTAANTSGPPSAVLLWDRYVASAFAYRWAETQVSQSGDPGAIMELVEAANANFRNPDLYIYLEIDVATSRHRSSEGSPESVLEHVPAGYARYFNQCDAPVSRVDAMQSPEQVMLACMTELIRYEIIGL